MMEAGVPPKTRLCKGYIACGMNLKGCGLIFFMNSQWLLVKEVLSIWKAADDSTIMVQNAYKNT